MVTICTTSLTFNNSTFCPHSVFMCFVWISEQTAIISLYSINWLVFITQTQCVYCAVRTGCYRCTYVNSRLPRVIRSFNTCAFRERLILKWFTCILMKVFLAIYRAPDRSWIHLARSSHLVYTWPFEWRRTGNVFWPLRYFNLATRARCRGMRHYKPPLPQAVALCLYKCLNAMFMEESYCSVVWWAWKISLYSHF